jgi:hypothetical protein
VCYAYGCLSRKDIVKGLVLLVLPANSDILRVETVTTRRETTWTQSVPFSVFESLMRSRDQEFIQGEFNYVQDLEALNEFIVGPLASGGALHGFPGSQSILYVFILYIYFYRVFIRIL